MTATLRFLYDGLFYLASEPCPSLSYRKKYVFKKEKVDTDLLSKFELEDMIKDGVNLLNVSELWYCKSGLTLHQGICQIKSDNDIVQFTLTGGSAQIFDVYVVQVGQPSPYDFINFAKERGVKASAEIGSPSRPRGSQNVGPIENPTIPAKIGNPSTHHVSGCDKGKGVVTPRSDELVGEIEDSGESGDDEGEIIGSETSGSEGSDHEDATYIEDVFAEEEQDDDLFKDHVDTGVVDEAVLNAEGEQEYEDVFDVRVDSEDYNSYSGSDDNRRLRYSDFNPLVDYKKKICLKPGLRFASKDIFRKALRQYALENGFDYYYLHNDNRKIYAYCLNKCNCGLKNGRKRCICKGSKLCDFKACAKRMGSDGCFQLKSFCADHNCGWQDKNTKLSSSWLAEKYMEHYRDDTRWRIKSFILAIMRDYMVTVNYHQAWRARMKAIGMTQEFAPEQYAKVWDYAATLLKHNPGSSVIVRPEESIERPLTFQRFYVCLKPCKEGFLAGCRPIIGLDGCHLKGIYTGQVLTAVAKDGNENIFPLAYAVVESETKATWCWFLELLKDDVGSVPLTFMSDRQKGLIEALNEIVPTADTRVCVRHLHNNFKKQWPGKTYKDAVWAAARSTTAPDFQEAMQVIREMDVNAEKYLMQQNPSTWSLHAFKYHPKSDMLLNNCCESFNSCILDAREMPILSMCEWIRRKLMKMFINKRRKMNSHQGRLTPVATEKINTARTESVFRCKCHGEGDRYEVDCGPNVYVVDLELRSCGCNVWDLTGLPCTHAISCILRRRLNIEDFVDAYYYKETYMRAYGKSVNPMPGLKHWEKSGIPPLQPPKLVVQPGRPKKNRRKEQGEETKSKQTRVRVGKNKCGNCGEVGHTKKSCKNPTMPPQAKPINTNKGGRPRKPTTMGFQPPKRKYVKRKERSYNQPRNEPVEEVGEQQMEMEQDVNVQQLIEEGMQLADEEILPSQPMLTPLGSIGDNNAYAPDEFMIPTQSSHSTMPPPITQNSGTTFTSTSSSKPRLYPTRKRASQVIDSVGQLKKVVGKRHTKSSLRLQFHQGIKPK